MLIKHWREQFINIAEDHSVHSHKRRELCYFNHIEKNPCLHFTSNTAPSIQNILAIAHRFLSVHQFSTMPQNYTTVCN